MDWTAGSTKKLSQNSIKHKVKSKDKSITRKKWGYKGGHEERVRKGAKAEQEGKMLAKAPKRQVKFGKELKGERKNRETDRSYATKTRLGRRGNAGSKRRIRPYELLVGGQSKDRQITSLAGATKIADAPHYKAEMTGMPMGGKCS